MFIFIFLKGSILSLINHWKRDNIEKLIQYEKTLVIFSPISNKSLSKGAVIYLITQLKMLSVQCTFLEKYTNSANVMICLLIN